MATMKPPKGRGGRPPAHLVGDIDTRLITSARRLFLDQGYEATSCEQVVVLAGAGKASLYARYANKEALFTAVVLHSVDNSFDWALEKIPDLPFEDRLVHAGTRLLENGLKPDVISIMRMVIETAPQLPQLAALCHRRGRDAGIHAIFEAISPRSDTDRTVSDARSCAEEFVDLAFAPQQFSALLGTPLDDLAQAIAPRVARVIDLMRSAGAFANLG